MSQSLDKAYRVPLKGAVDFNRWDPNDKALCPDGKKAGHLMLKELKAELASWQEIMYAQRKHKLLIVLQGMDTGGKDGTIRNVFGWVDPQGVKVATFSRPTSRELSHDFLWRIHRQTPQRGEIVIFNRSHYEDVLAVRVRNLVPKAVWAKRFEHINNFEKMLADEGTTILKFYLHIDREEQKQRLLSRQQTPRKQWKLEPADLEDRKLWPDYIEAYKEAIGRTNTSYAPWYIVPANRKWHRNLIVASIIIDTIKRLKPEYPKPNYDVSSFVIE